MIWISQPKEVGYGLTELEAINNLCWRMGHPNRPFSNIKTWQGDLEYGIPYINFRTFTMRAWKAKFK